jgi:hypothetical protein
MKPEFTYAEIDAMRAKLAKLWRQSIDQVTECEARYYLRCGSLNGAE